MPEPRPTARTAVGRTVVVAAGMVVGVVVPVVVCMAAPVVVGMGGVTVPLIRALGLLNLITHVGFPSDGWTAASSELHYVLMNARMHLSPAHDGHPQDPSEEQITLAVEVLALLADRTRLTLLHALTTGETDVTTLTGACGAARPAVSQHLAKLRLAGLVTSRKEGRRVIYGLRDGHLRRVINEALNLADHHLHDRPPHG
jgi:DNA-binding transcriptional ArsR family regulator